MAQKTWLLIQEGIPAPQDWLESFCHPVWFNQQSAEIIFRENYQVSYLLLRANFQLTPALLELLPKLSKIGLVSTGSDNLPQRYLKSRGIRLHTAEGANARAVMEYCVQAIFHWANEHPEEVNRGVGIIGKGRIGSLLLEFIQRIDIPVSWYDPFIPGSYPLERVMQHTLLTWHVPLTHNGPYPTANFIHRIIIPDGTIHRIINTSRGGIWHKPSINYFADNQMIWAQDVYTQEPPQSLPQARFSTPHIAGYSTKGRLGGMEKVIKAIFPEIPPVPLPKSEPWYLSEESDRFTANPQKFAERRDNFPWRKEFADYDPAERQAFREHFSGLPKSWLTALWPHEAN